MENIILKINDPIYGEYEIYEDNTDYKTKRVRFKDKKFESMNKTCVEYDEDYGMYFVIDNPYVNSSNIWDKILNQSNAEDMINSIRDGYGDAIISNMFGRCVVRCVSRDIGEDLRQKSIEGYKNTIFKYALLCKNTFGLNLRKSVVNNKLKTIYFNSDKEAKLYLADNELEANYEIIKSVYIENDDNYLFFKEENLCQSK